MRETTRIFRFVVIGTLNALITAATIGVMMGVCNVHYLASNVTAYVLAQTNNFVWCKYWIFPTNKKSNTWRQVLLFLIAFGMAYGAQFLFLSHWSSCLAATNIWPSSSVCLSTVRSIS